MQGNWVLDFYLFIYLSVKRNFVTERKSLVLGFLTSLRNTPSSQEMFPLFWCVVPHSQSVPSLTDFPPDTITLATTQRNQQRDDSITLPKQKKKAYFESYSTRKPFICWCGSVPCKGFWSELTTAPIPSASLPLRSLKGCPPLNLNIILYWPWTGDRLSSETQKHIFAEQQESLASLLVTPLTRE